MLMRAKRHLAPQDEDTFGIITSANILDLWHNLTAVIADSMVGIVSVFLVIGGVVIMNVMLASVTERTREIGIRKSLGARRQDILVQFLVGVVHHVGHWRSDRHHGGLRARRGSAGGNGHSDGGADYGGHCVVERFDRRGAVFWDLPGAEGGPPRSH